MKNGNSLIILAKSPLKDNVKTRLIGHLSDEERLNLYEYLLKNTITKLSDIPGVDSFISYSPADAGTYFSRFGLRMFPQSRGDIGERMFNAISRVLTSGYRKVALVGVDIPEISDSIVLRAFDLLTDNDIAIGPARDGGYYLVGLKAPVREIFEDMEWSTPQTLRQTLQKASSCGYSTALTETLSDIDTITDVKAMRL